MSLVDDGASDHSDASSVGFGHRLRKTCWCEEPETEDDMVLCGDCQVWFHYECVPDFDPETYPAGVDWVCPGCDFDTIAVHRKDTPGGLHPRGPPFVRAQIGPDGPKSRKESRAAASHKPTDQVFVNEGSNREQSVVQDESQASRSTAQRHLTILCHDSEGRPEAVVLGAQDLLKKSSHKFMGYLKEKMENTDAQNVGFVRFRRISSAAGRMFQKWFGAGQQIFNGEAASEDDAYICLIEVSALAHAFAIPKLQNTVMEVLCAHFPDQQSPNEYKPPTEVLRKMWKVTMEGCPARELLLRIATTFLKAQGATSPQAAPFMSLLRQTDHRGVDLRSELKKRVNNDMTVAPGRTSDGYVTLDVDSLPEWGPGCALEILDDQGGETI